MQLTARKTAIVTLLLIAAAGLFLRLWQIDSQSLWMDEAFSLTSVEGILQHGYPLLPNDQSSFRAESARYVYAFFALLSPWDNIVTLRAVSALLGTALLFLVYAISYKVFRSRPAALLSTAMLAFLTWEIAWSRQIRMYIFLQAYFLLGVYFFEGFWQRQDYKNLAGTAVFVILSIYTHTAGFLLPFYILLRSSLGSGELTPFFKDAFARHKNWFIALSVAVFALGFFALQTALMHFINSPAISGSGAVAIYLPDYLSWLWQQLNFVFLLALAGFVFAYRSGAQGFATSMAILFVAYLVYLSFFNKVFALRYLLPIVPILLIFAALPLAKTIEFAFARDRLLKISLYLFSFLAFLVFAGGSLLPRAHYELGPSAPQANMKQAYSYIQENSIPGSAVNIVSYLPVFADIYLAGDANKYYIPFSMDGTPASTHPIAPYSAAVTVKSLADLPDEGFLILDDYGFKMLRAPEIKNILQKRRALLIEPEVGSDRVLIWNLRDLKNSE